MTRFPSKHWIACCLAAAFAFAGCTGDTTSGETSGSLSLSLELAEGIVINEVEWTISGGPMDGDMSGTIDTSAPGATASIEVFGLPPNDGDDPYTIMLEAVSEDGGTACKGSENFTVDAGEVTDIMVFLNCKRPNTLGGVRANGKFNICAEIAKATVAPLQTSVGNDIDLSATVVDVEDDDVEIIWTGTGGSVDDPSSDDTTYTCGEVGDQTITLTVSDDGMIYCIHKKEFAVTCVEGDEDLCEDVVCVGDGNECTVTECNPANGECETENVDDGTECDSGEGVCMDGVCEAADLCEGVDCDDQNECTTDVCDPADGSCANDPVDDGTSCDGGAGMCVNGECMATDLCEGVTCDPTNNECTVAVCNNQTGECEEMNRPDGTECMDGIGACSNGECIMDNLCDGVDCASDNDCVLDGTCDPADGECIPGNNEEAGATCDLAGTGDGVCDGSGTCVECNGANNCPDDGNECTTATCENNTCGQANVMDGAVCDFMGGDGICEMGTCVEAPECISPGDCNDGNPCTSGECPDGMCVFSPVNGGSCDADGVPGTCDGGMCVGLCEGKDCNDQNECTDDSCDTADGSCVNTPVTDGTSCSGGEGTCQSGECQPNVTVPDPISKPITLGCRNNLTTDISILPWELDTEPLGPIAGGQQVDIRYSGTAIFTETFLDAGLAAVPGLNKAALAPGNRGGATVVPRAGLSGADVELEPAPIPTTCNAGMNAGGSCVTDADCPPVGYFFCREIVELPTSSDQATCDALGPPKDTQFDNNGFCITGPLPLPLETKDGSYTADASGDALIGWVDTNNEGLNGDGTYMLPAANFAQPWQPAGLRVLVGILQVALNCNMAVDSGGPGGVDVPDQASPTPDSELISYQIQ